RRAPRPPLLPYTTLFRSRDPTAAGATCRSRLTSLLLLLLPPLLEQLSVGLGKRLLVEQVRPPLRGPPQRLHPPPAGNTGMVARQDRKSTRLNSSHVKSRM